MDLRVIVSAKLLLVLEAPAAQRLGKVTLRILAADHEADLARWVGWDGSIGIFDVGEDLLAVLLELGDQWEVKPLILG